jgi:transposase
VGARELGMGSDIYDVGFKEAMVRKMIGPPSRSATALAGEVGVAQTTLSRWLNEYGRLAAEGQMSSKKRSEWNAQEKLAMVLEYEKLDEEARGRYLREKGLYSVDIQRWREEILKALGKRPKGKADEKDRRIRELEGELRRKEKALAETAALLVLKKKAQAIWGDGEEEK